MVNRKSNTHPVMVNSQENQTRLREYLMTSFFLMVIYDLLTKPIASGIINWLNIQIGQNPYLPFFSPGFDYNILLSTLPNGNINMLITIIALIFTGIYCGFIFKLSGWLLYIPGVKSYLEDSRRKSFYSSPTGAVILLSFLLSGLLIIFLYPILGAIIITSVIIASKQETN